MKTTNWAKFDRVEKLKEWIDSQPDSDDAFEQLQEAHRTLPINKEQGLNRWVAAAIIGDFSSFSFSDEFLGRKWDVQKMSEDSDYYAEIQQAVLTEVRQCFNEFTSLEVVKDDRRAAGSEDIDIDINDEGVIESMGEYWLMASNETFWNVTFEFDDEGPTVIFEYVEGSYEELRS
jgi:hypothetical protein